MIKIIHFADLHLGVENYGRIDPATGLSSRLGDFLNSLDELVDYALAEKVDLVLFCGDAYKTREPTQTQQREFARRINRLASSDISVFLLVGNHDMPNAIGRATATEIFDTLTVKNVTVASRPGTFKIQTTGGAVQVSALPWLRRSALLSREDTKNLNLEQVNQRMQEALTQVISSQAVVLDPSLPAILAAHVSVGAARAGSESMMAIGQEPVLLLSNIALPAFDYVALGHIHKHQVLAENPPVVYAGSLERIDFSEEDDEKGFYVIDIETGQTSRKVTFDFHPVKARRFLTIAVTLGQDDPDPTAKVLDALSHQKENIKNAIVRLNLDLPSQIEGQLRYREMQEALKDAHYFTIAREIRRETRIRLGNHSSEEITPLAALKAYLEAQKVPPERQKILMERGEKLLGES
ncbi:MAG: exonuclease SbcCD subunit D [Dehalococcoidales bacterium]